MPVYEWQGRGEFRDNRNDRTISPGEQVELDAEIAEGHREFVAVEAAEPEGDGESLPDLSGSEWQSMAAAYDGFEEAHGRSSAEDIKAEFRAFSDGEQAEALDALEDDGE